MSKIRYFLILFLLLFHLLQVSGTCGSKKVHCINSTTYQTCSWFLWWEIYDSEYYICTKDTACDQDYGSSVCVATTTTTIEPTTAAQETRPNSCSSTNMHCFNDTTYRQCKKLVNVYFYSGPYMSCPDGTTCNENGTDGVCVQVTTTAMPESTTAATQEGNAWWCWLTLNLLC